MAATSPHASNALAHFFVGLMKTDGGITSREKAKVETLIRRFQSGLPTDADDMMVTLEAEYRDPKYSKWKPEDHLSEAFRSFDLFVESGMALVGHMDTMMDLVEILMEVDGVTDAELQYIHSLREEFRQRYKLKR